MLARTVGLIVDFIVVNSVIFKHFHHLQFLGRVAVCTAKAAYSRQTFPVTICRSVCLWVCVSVYLWDCPVHCGKTADRTRVPFGMVGTTGPGMRQVVKFGDRSTGRGNFGGEYERPIVTSGRLFTIGNCLLYTSDAADE